MSEKLWKIFFEISQNVLNSFCGMCVQFGLREENQQIVMLEPEDRRFSSSLLVRQLISFLLWCFQLHVVA